SVILPVRCRSDAPIRPPPSAAVKRRPLPGGRKRIGRRKSCTGRCLGQIVSDTLGHPPGKAQERTPPTPAHQPSRNKAGPRGVVQWSGRTIFTPSAEVEVSVEASAGYGDWTVGLRVWVERAGRAVLGPGRLELLEAIDRDHSISAAARNL